MTHDEELVRFTPKLLMPQQVAALIDLCALWNNVYISDVGPGQFGVIGPAQRREVILREAHQIS